MIAFWILAPIMVLAALGVLFVRKAVHAALLLAVVMVSLAVLYLALEAPFLFAVQIIVYTGAILMLFLFVLMLVGVDASDSVVETIRGQRVLAVLGGLGLGLLLVLGVSQVSLGEATGLGATNADGNIEALANVLFSRYVFAFEVTSALLITAALGAMVLAHRERLVPKATQADLAAQRVRDFAEHGTPLGPLPAPGVFARHNAVGTPALLPDGSVAESSISRVLAARGTIRSAPLRDVVRIQADIDSAARAVRPRPRRRDPARPDRRCRRPLGGRRRPRRDRGHRPARRPARAPASPTRSPRCSTTPASRRAAADDRTSPPTSSSRRSSSRSAPSACSPGATPS